jgi:hypothetical protein
MVQLIPYLVQVVLEPPKAKMNNTLVRVIQFGTFGKCRKCKGQTNLAVDNHDMLCQTCLKEYYDKMEF